MNRAAPQARDTWTDYWRSGRGASCFESCDAEMRLNRLWDEFVDGLADGSRLLDLATGNGTVAACCAARGRARGLRLSISAVDAAAIDPPKYVADPDRLLRDVSFRGGVRLEELPFDAAAFDGIVSQFGFEYADEEQASAEVARCLAPGGRLRFVLHAREGAVARDTALRLKRLRGVLADDGALAVVRALVDAALAGDRAALTARSAQLPAAAAAARRLSVNPPSEDAALFYAGEFLRLWARRDRYRMTDVRRSVEDGWANALGVALRQEEMLKAARSAADMVRLRARLSAFGFDVAAARELRDARNLQVAWLLDAGKPPPSG